jgi:hypothetical protein
MYRIAKSNGLALIHDCEHANFNLDSFSEMIILEPPRYDEFNAASSQRCVLMVGEYIFFCFLCRLEEWRFYFCHKDNITGDIIERFIFDEWSIQIDGTSCVSKMHGLNFRHYLNDNDRSLDVLFECRITMDYELRQKISYLDLEHLLRLSENLLTITMPTIGDQLYFAITVEIATNKKGLRNKIIEKLTNVNNMKESLGFNKFNFDQVIRFYYGWKHNHKESEIENLKSINHSIKNPCIKIF